MDCVFNKHVEQIEAHFNDIYEIADNTPVLCDGCIQLIDKVQLLHTDFNNFTSYVSQRITTLENTVAKLTKDNKDLTTSNNDLTAKILALNNKIENTETTNHFMIIMGDVVQKLYTKIKRYAKTQPEYNQYGTWEDFIDDVNDDDPTALLLYDKLLAHFMIDPNDYKTLIALKDNRNSLFHSGIKTKDDVKRELAGLRANIRIQNIRQCMKILDIADKYVPLL